MVSYKGKLSPVAQREKRVRKKRELAIVAVLAN
jgi:hypothetical protein